MSMWQQQQLVLAAMSMATGMWVEMFLGNEDQRT